MLNYLPRVADILETGTDVAFGTLTLQYPMLRILQTYNLTLNAFQLRWMMTAAVRVINVPHIQTRIQY